MPLVILLIVLGLLIGGVSFVVETLAWLLVVGIVVLIIGAVLGVRLLRGGRGQRPLDRDGAARY